MREPEEITADLGEAYAQWKDGEKDKNKYKDEFFGWVLDRLSSRTLGQKTISLGDVDEVETEADAREWVERHYPKWKLLEIRVLDDDSDVVAVLEEDPQYIDYAFPNPVDKKVYRRQVVDGGSLLDIDRLKTDDPDLWERITVEETRRVPLPLDDLPAQDFAAVQKFMYPGRPTVKFPAPSKAKEEDFSDGDEE